MTMPRVYVDFHNADPQGRVRLNCTGTTRDLQRQEIEPHEGLRLKLYSDDGNEVGHPDELEVEGIVEYSTAENCWVARIDWSLIRHVSSTSQTGNGASRTGVKREPGPA